MSNIDPLELRNAFGKFMTGVTVVTTLADDGTPIGFTANSFSSVSLDPPLLLVCPAKSMSSFSVFEQCEYFSVNVLAYNQQSISNTFASKSDDRFENIDWIKDENGCPRIAGTIASFACKRDRSIDAGDHIILLGQITDFEKNEEHGLGYREGGYFSLELERKASEMETKTHGQAKKVNVGGLLEWQDKLLLNFDGESFSFPSIELDEDHASHERLEEYLKDLLNVPLTIGSVFSVFDHANKNRSSIYYRVSLDCEEPQLEEGISFYSFDDINADKFSSNACTTMYLRYLAERKSGNYSIYFGTDAQGQTQKVDGG